MPPTPDIPAPLYVSCVDGKPVSRFRLGGRGGARAADLIGATRGEGRAITYDVERVVMISGAEVAAFGREYERAIRDGNLTRRTAEDFTAYQAASKTRAAEAAATATKSAEAPAPAGGTVS